MGNSTPSASGGGAIAISGSSTDVLTATNTKFHTNSATANGSSGGGILALDGVSVVLNHCAFTDNTADASGGAVEVWGGGALTVSNASEFNTNQATGSGSVGGAIRTSGTLTVTSSTTASTKFIGNSAGYGGAIWYAPSQSSSLSLTNITFTNNTAGAGGAIDAAADPASGTVTVTITGCLFDTNYATDSTAGDGGAIRVRHVLPEGTGSASLTITNSTFYSNSAEHNGGAIYLDNSNAGSGTNTVALTSLTIYNNQAVNQGGGLWTGMTAALLLPKVWNSIIAGNNLENTAEDGWDVKGEVSSDKGYNLIGRGEGSSGWATSCQVGTASSPKAAGLDTSGPSDQWGGVTKTIKLLTTSLAYQTGDPQLSGTTDQRGYTRRHDTTNKVSIGAYDPDALAP